MVEGEVGELEGAAIFAWGVGRAAPDCVMCAIDGLIVSQLSGALGATASPAVAKKFKVANAGVGCCVWVEVDGASIGVRVTWGWGWNRGWDWGWFSG